MSSEKQPGFKRLNFFQGFVTTTKDWSDAEAYHLTKHRLHNRCFHGVGVVPGFEQGFAVNARGRRDLSVEVSPGYAIDGQGNDVILWQTAIRTLNKAAYELPCTVYLVASHVEEPIDFATAGERSEYRGHRRVLERARVEFTTETPDPRLGIELARVRLTEDARELTEADDPAHPGENEIDRRFVPLADVAGGNFSHELFARLRILLAGQRRYFSTMARERKVISANVATLAVMTLEMLIESHLVGPRNVIGLIGQVSELALDVVREIETRKPVLSARPDFEPFKTSVIELRKMFVLYNREDRGGAELDLDPLRDLLSQSEVSAARLTGLVTEPAAEDA